MIPFWWACCTAWQTGTNSSSRCRGVSWCSSQYSVIGTPLTSSMTKYGRPASVVPASSTLAMFGWSISARACRSASNRAMTCLRVHARLDELQRHLALDRLGLLGHVDGAHAALADLLHAACTGRSTVPADSAAGGDRCRAGRRRTSAAGGSRKLAELRRGPRAAPRRGAAAPRRRRRPRPGTRPGPAPGRVSTAARKIDSICRSVRRIAGPPEAVASRQCDGRIEDRLNRRAGFSGPAAVVAVELEAARPGRTPSGGRRWPRRRPARRPPRRRSGRRSTGA